MAGIKANSVTVTMTDGDTSPTNTFPGFITGETITLTTTPTGLTYSWTLAKPLASTARVSLTDDTDDSPTFSADVAGDYLVSVTVNGSTDYTLTLNVTQVAITKSAETFRVSPKLANAIPSPALGASIFFDTTTDRIQKKDTAGVVTDLEPGGRNATFTLASGTVTVTDTSITALTVMSTSLITSTNPGRLTFAFTTGVDVVITSSDGTDASVYRYALLG